MTSPLLTDSFFDGLESSTLDLADSETLPPECYTDAGFYEFEKEALFNHEWLCVGRVEQVKNPGDYFTTKIIGEPLLIAKDRAGEIRAMSSVCQHRAMLVAEGAGNTRGFRGGYASSRHSISVAPIAGKGDITAANADALGALLDQHGDGVLLHCASGNRAGALLALGAARAGMPAAEALALGRKAGLASLEPVVAAQLERTGAPAGAE